MNRRPRQRRTTATGISAGSTHSSRKPARPCQAGVLDAGLRVRCGLPCRSRSARWPLGGSVLGVDFPRGGGRSSRLASTRLRPGRELTSSSRARSSAGSPTRAPARSTRRSSARPACCCPTSRRRSPASTVCSSRAGSSSPARPRWFPRAARASRRDWALTDALLEGTSGRLPGFRLALLARGRRTPARLSSEPASGTSSCRASGAFSGIEGDPLSTLVRPSDLDDQGRAALARVEEAFALTNPDVGRYLLAAPSVVMKNRLQNAPRGYAGAYLGRWFRGRAVSSAPGRDRTAGRSRRSARTLVASRGLDRRRSDGDGRHPRPGAPASSPAARADSGERSARTLVVGRGVDAVSKGDERRLRRLAGALPGCEDARRGTESSTASVPDCAFAQTADEVPIEPRYAQRIGTSSGRRGRPAVRSRAGPDQGDRAGLWVQCPPNPARSVRGGEQARPAKPRGPGAGGARHPSMRRRSRPRPATSVRRSAANARPCDPARARTTLLSLQTAPAIAPTVHAPAARLILQAVLRQRRSDAPTRPSPKARLERRLGGPAELTAQGVRVAVEPELVV